MAKSRSRGSVVLRSENTESTPQAGPPSGSRYVGMSSNQLRSDPETSAQSDYRGESGAGVLESPTRSRRALHVLVVDDEPALCSLFCEMLQSDGHSTEWAADGSAALSKFSSGTFDLVITDQSIAWMTGRELAAEIKKLRPEVPVVLLTGLIEERGGAGSSGPIDLLLAKPISYDGLRNALAPFSG
jgi:CheY-like chemotaxis protein